MNLLPCPFCGVVPEVLPMHHHGHYVECENDACPTKPETRGFDTEEQAVATWNQRPPVPMPVSA